MRNASAALLTGALLGIGGCHGEAGLADMADMVRPADMAETQAVLIQNGMQHVTDRGCPMCHQSDSPADGVLSGSSTPVPGTMIMGPNLTSDPDTGLAFWTDDQIMRAMRKGLDSAGRPMCWVMPHWKMGDQEALEIVAYLRSLPPVMHDIPLGACPPNGADGGG